MRSCLEDFDYTLPRELIAAYPAPERSGSRLLVVDRKTRKFEHRIFRDIGEYLKAGDLLVLNDTKVLPARLWGVRPTGGRVEALLLKPREGGVWEMLVKPSRRIKKGTRIVFGENEGGAMRALPLLEGDVLDDPDGRTGIRRIRFVNAGAGLVPAPGGRPQGLPLHTILDQIGRIPLPPYLGRPDEAVDRERYQTVFAEKEGAVASPTAGLHFDKTLLGALKKKGVETCFVTLHVGCGTFRPVRVEDLSRHEMEEEEFEITGEAAGQIQKALEEKRRIVACGTTVVRVLETVSRPLTLPSPPEGERVGVRGKTRLFIYPPHEFKVVDALITNFHLPRTTLLMLVSAFAGRGLLLGAYQEAIRRRYRFYSYGDAMLVL